MLTDTLKLFYVMVCMYVCNGSRGGCHNTLHVEMLMIHQLYQYICHLLTQLLEHTRKFNCG
jgi:hypothetical protein